MYTHKNSFKTFIIINLLSDHYQKILPDQINLRGLRGFGYSFSNVKSRQGREYEMPSFAIGSVNDDYDSSDANRNVADKVILFDFFCINLKCKSTVESPPTIKKEEG